jgi:hypothetical protein
MTRFQARAVAAVAALLLGCGNGSSPRGDGATDAGTDAHGIACPPTKNVREEIAAESVFFPQIAVDAAGGVHVVYHLDDTGPEYGRGTRTVTRRAMRGAAKPSWTGVRLAWPSASSRRVPSTF